MKTTPRIHIVRRTLAIGIGSCSAAAAFMSLAGGVAVAEVEEIAPGPVVSSRQASEISVVRINDYGVARGISEARVADAGVVSAVGEVRDSTKAIVGGTASAFDGGWPSGPGIGDW